MGRRVIVAPDVLARATAPHALSGAKGPDRTRASGGGRGVCAASVHPETDSRGAGGLESVGGGACQGVPAGVFGGLRAQRVFLPDAAQPTPPTPPSPISADRAA